MKMVIQRVNNAAVTVSLENYHQAIKKGYLVYVSFTKGDNLESVKKAAMKIKNLRLFPDENDRMNLNLSNVNAEVLVVSSFSLYGDITTSNRPGFTKQLPKDDAIVLYNAFINELENLNVLLKTGIFGANMSIDSQNAGPVTCIYESIK